jgi:hypothetical protein
VPTRARGTTASHTASGSTSLRLDGIQFAKLDRLARRAIRRLADKHAVDRSRGLQARCRVHNVARRHALPGLRACVEVNQCFARVHRDPRLNRILLARPITNRERGAHSAFRIVLVRNRRTEERHDRIADELLHRAAEPLELASQALVIGTEDRLDVFGVELLARREADQVGK